MPETELLTAARAALLIIAIIMTGCGETGTRHVAAPAQVQQGAPATTAVITPDSIVFPPGQEGVAARRGFAILAATHDSMPQYVGSGLRCFSCHLDNGRRANSIPLTNAYTRYPAYTSRDNRVISIQDRVNNCFRRSLSGRDIPIDGEQMNAIIMYLSVISHGIPAGAHLRGEGMPALPQLNGDTARGNLVFTARCARCHGENGQGIPPATPLWGPRSYSIGASLARVSRTATFIRHNMPLDSAGVLNDQQAYDVASFVLSHPRPDARDKQSDWASGGAPPDVPYDTHGHSAFKPPRLLPYGLR